jgi:hypothetical protein
MKKADPGLPACETHFFAQQKNPMTYNFDPDRWYDNERAVLEKRRESGELSAGRFEQALEELDRRYEQMVERLDGTYRLPPDKSA